MTPIMEIERAIVVLLVLLFMSYSILAPERCSRSFGKKGPESRIRFLVFEISKFVI